MPLLRPRFHLNAASSPTYYKVREHLEQQGWQSTNIPWLARFGERNFQFNVDVAEQLEFKHRLAQLVTECAPDLMPETFCINDQNWVNVLNMMAKQHAWTNPWILKPSMLNNGKHIHIFQHSDELEQHYLLSNRLGGEHVLQRYLWQPHLLRGHKYSIRMFVVLTHSGAYLYPHGYFNVSRHPYQSKTFQSLNAHLTNEHLNDAEANVIQIPTERMDVFPSLYPTIQSMLTTVIQALQSKHSLLWSNKKQTELAIFGFDFMVDESMRVWLLEANHGPCFPIENDHPLQHYLYDGFWQAFIEKFVNHIASKIFYKL